jgi:hypothetical protein
MGKKKTEPKDEIAPLEAYAPQAVMLQGEDFLIRGCDGDQEYVWVAHWRKKTYVVIELYPGLLAKRTAIRDADEPDDLKLEARFKDLPEVLEELTEILMEGFEDDGDGGVPEPVPKTKAKLTLAASN